ncbi:carbonic anhydrase 2-like protein [Tanacetum coccineum]
MGPHCTWKKQPPKLSKKSNSTCFPRLWRHKDKVGRSKSDGRDAFLFLKKCLRTAVEGSSLKGNGGKRKGLKAKNGKFRNMRNFCVLLFGWFCNEKSDLEAVAYMKIKQLTLELEADSAKEVFPIEKIKNEFTHSKTEKYEMYKFFKCALHFSNDALHFIGDWVKICSTAKSKVQAEFKDLNFAEQCTKSEMAVNVSLGNLLSYPFVKAAVMSKTLSLKGGYYDFVKCSFDTWSLDYGVSPSLAVK